MKRISLILLLVVGCSSPEYGREKELVEFHNEIRVERNLTQLAISVKLSVAAQRHAEWMAEHEILAHDPSRKNTLTIRVNETGYKWSVLAENIAEGYENNDSVMRGWKKSPGHWNNIIRNDITDIGVGIAYSKNGRLYHCVVFGRPSR